MLGRLLREPNILRLLGMSILLGITESFMLLWQINVVKDVFDLATTSKLSSLITVLIVLGVLIMMTTAIRAVLAYCRDLFSVRLRNRMSINLFSSYLSSEHKGVKELHSGDVMNRIVQDISIVTSFFSDILPKIISNIVLIFGAFVYLCFINYKMAIFVIVISPLFLICGRLFLKKADVYIRKVRELESKAQALFQEVIQNKLVIKINRTVKYVIRQYSIVADELEASVVKKNCYSMKMNFLMSSGFSAVYLMTLGWGCLQLADEVITIGEMAAILQLTDRIQNPARSLSDLIPNIAAFIVAKRRLYAIYRMIPENAKIISLNPPIGIRLENVSFSYKAAHKEVLRNFSFCFKPNSFTIVKGESGTGKTTLVNLILAVYKPDSGNIFVYDAQNEMSLSPGIRDYVEYVPQGNNVLSGTVEENLRLGNPDASHEEMKEALQMACADFILSNRDGLLTKCAEKGVGLSEGQAQRILIARALLRKRPLLILDEATSALDEKTEMKLMKNLMSFTSKTVIFITHKKQLENVGDTILKL